MTLPSPLITRWTTQAGREPPAFAPDRARLDPRGLPELLADIVRLAADIPFHNDAGEADGDWRRILLADRSFVLALLATADIDARAEPLTALLEQAHGIGSPREHERRLTELVETLLRFADDLDDWLGPADLGDATQGRSIRRLAEDAVVAQSEAQAHALWALREGQSAAQKPEGMAWKHDVSVPVSLVARFIAEATAAVEAFAPGARVAAFGHVGDGNIHFDVVQPVGGDPAEHLARRDEGARIVHDIAHKLGGSISAEHGLGTMKTAEALRYKDPATVAALRAVRQALDPQRLMNPRVLF